MTIIITLEDQDKRNHGPIQTYTEVCLTCDRNIYDKGVHDWCEINSVRAMLKRVEKEARDKEQFLLKMKQYPPHAFY